MPRLSAVRAERADGDLPTAHATSGPSLGWAAAVLGAWLAVTVAVAIVRPGFLLETALIGLAAAVAWSFLAWRPLARAEAAVAVLCFVAPLLVTWPGRRWASFLDLLSPPVAAALGVGSVATVAAWLALGSERRWRTLDPVLLTSAVLFAVAAALSTLAAVDGPQAAHAAWLALIVPIGGGLAVAWVVRALADGWRLLGILQCAAAVPLLVGVAAYLEVFGLPTTGADLVAAREDLWRPSLLQDLTLGNLDNVGAFCVLILPAAAVAAWRPGATGPARLAAAVAAVAALVLLVLTVDRAALGVAVLALAAVGGLLLLVGLRRGGAITIAVALVVAAGLVGDPDLRAYVTPAVTAHLATATAGPQLAAVPRGVLVAASDGSAAVRGSAIRRGLDVGVHHLPWGVGSGAYSRYDPVHTAPHSLPVALLAENGLAGLAGFLALVLFVLRAAWQGVARRAGRSVDRTLLVGAAALGSGAFLVLGTVAGAPLALGQIDVWALVLWLQVGLLAAAAGGTIADG